MAIYVRPKDSMPEKWYKNVELARERAKSFMGKLVALHQTSSVVIGKLTGAEIDKLWQVKYPYCKISMKRAFRFNLNGKLETDIGDDGIFWINKPEVLLSIDELSRKFPKVYSEILPKIKRGVW